MSVVDGFWNSKVVKGSVGKPLLKIKIHLSLSFSQLISHLFTALVMVNKKYTLKNRLYSQKHGSIQSLILMHPQMEKLIMTRVFRICSSYFEHWNYDTNFPDEPFHNFIASRSGDRRILCSSRTSHDGFWSSKNVKRFVGLCVCIPTELYPNLEPENPTIDVSGLHKIRRLTSNL